MENGTQRWEKDGNRDLDVWRLPDGTLHRTDGPAFRRLLKEHCETEIWAQNGDYFRGDGGPTGVIHGHFYSRHEPKPSDVLYTELWVTGPVGDRPYVGNAKVPRHRVGAPAEISHFRGGGIRREAWFVDGKQHRDDGPAETEWSVDGQVVATAWYRDGERVAAPDGATNHEFFDDGTTRRQMWLVGRDLHNEDGPAYLEWFPDGSPKSVEHWVDGLMSRPDGPAAVEYSAEGGVRCEQWRIADRLHRQDGPAVVYFHPNGSIAEHQWWTDGRRRTSGGPAIEQFDESGELTTAFDWTMPEARSAPFHRLDYHEFSSEPGSDHSYQMDEYHEGRSLRLWHRWMLGLDDAPADAPFTQSDWLGSGSEEEVRSRVAYLPDADRIAARVLEWRTWPRPSLPDDEEVVKTITTAYLQYLRSMNEDIDFRRKLFDNALAGEFIVSDRPPEPGDGENYVGDYNDSTDYVDVPRLFIESIYNASGNYYMPIYWILEPLHGLDVSAWRDFEQANLTAVIGPTRIVAGPRR